MNTSKHSPKTLNNTTLIQVTRFNEENSCTFPEDTRMNWWKNFEYFRFNYDGSITCKPSKEALDCLETQSLPISILWENSLNAQLVGEDGCINNFDMYTPIYFPIIGLAYLIPHSISEKWKGGEEVTFYGYEPNKEEKEEFIEWWLNH